MIENISINNYALIDHTHIELEKGFSVITGETGAGKSILLGAIGLTLGQRADSSAIMDKIQKVYCRDRIQYRRICFKRMVRRERPRLFRTGYGQEGVDCRRKITLFYQRYPGK